MAVKKVFLRTAYNYDMDEVSTETGLCCEDPTLTQQQFAKECDINTIVEAYGLNGELPQTLRAPEYGDYSEITDYASALAAVKNAESNFMLLPAKLRARFENDPQQFLRFVHDDANYQEARDLGLLEVVENSVPVKVPGQPVNADAPVEAPKAS